LPIVPRTLQENQWYRPLWWYIEFLHSVVLHLSGPESGRFSPPRFFPSKIFSSFRHLCFSAFVDLAGLEAQHFLKEAQYLFHCCLHLRKSSGNNKGSAETVHKPYLYMGALHRRIRSHNHCFPGGETHHADGFSRMVFAFMNAYMQSQIVIDPGIGRRQDMRQTYFLARNTDTGHAQLLSFQVFITVAEQLLQQFFSGHSSHIRTSYLFVILQTTYPRESRK